MKARVLHGDCLRTMRLMRARGVQVDSIVTDPPYHLQSIVKRFSNSGRTDSTWSRSGLHQRTARGFMGRAWDGGDIAMNPETWALAYDALKPGGHMLVFGGTRTFHRVAVAIEDAGFEIRDTVMWLYGSGFPKSQNVGKHIDKMAGAEREVLGVERRKSAPSGIVSAGRESVEIERDITAPATDAARQWEGWGTALKPAWEPIIVARKPLSEKSVAANVLAHGTGALNIKGCRVESAGDHKRGFIGARPEREIYGYRPRLEEGFQPTNAEGRWPANLVHDGSDEVVEAFPDADGAASNGRRGVKGLYNDGIGAADQMPSFDDTGSAARFFYSAKADAADRCGSKHPTVKPVDLIAYLCRLVTPQRGLVLDPFAGSGTTGMACLREGFRCVLIEREAEYAADIRRRLKHVRGEDGSLFEGVRP